MTGYITESEVFVDLYLVSRQIYPAFKVVPSLSRLMQSGISKGHSSESFSKVFDMAVHMESSRCFHNDF